MENKLTVDFSGRPRGFDRHLVPRKVSCSSCLTPSRVWVSDASSTGGDEQTGEKSSKLEASVCRRESPWKSSFWGQALVTHFCHFDALRSTKVTLRHPTSLNDCSRGRGRVCIGFLHLDPSAPQDGSDVSRREGGKGAEAQPPAQNSGDVFGAIKIMLCAIAG